MPRRLQTRSAQQSSTARLDVSAPPKKRRAAVDVSVAPSKRTKKLGASAPAATRPPSAAAFSVEPTTTLADFQEFPPDPATSALPVINHAPTDVLTVLVFGTGDSCGELGLGPAIKTAKRATVIPQLDGRQPDSYNVVQLDCGGMHTIALTRDNKILTWGGNDKGALGRDTTWDGGLRDMDIDSNDNSKSDSDSDSDDEEMNPLEAVPNPIPEHSFPAGTRFVQVAAGDSCSFAVTDLGLVYGWGTFLNENGDENFLYYKGERLEVARKPMLMPGLKNISKIVCGANHAIAIDTSGRVWSWGVNEKNQVGRRVHPQHDYKDNYYPGVLDLSRHGVKALAAGPFHSLAVDNKDRVFAWGLNNFGQAGYANNAGIGGAEMPFPMQIRTLSKQGINIIAAGNFHSAAVTSDGRFLVWGRIDGGHLGVQLSQEYLDDPRLVRRDEYDKPRILLQPVEVPNIGSAAFVACSTGHTVFVNKEGKAYASGFGFQHQLGNGSEDDSDVAQEVRAKSLNGIKLTWCGTGGQFSMVAGAVKDIVPKTNGTK